MPSSPASVLISVPVRFDVGIQLGHLGFEGRQIHSASRIEHVDRLDVAQGRQDLAGDELPGRDHRFVIQGQQHCRRQIPLVGAVERVAEIIIALVGRRPAAGGVAVVVQPVFIARDMQPRLTRGRVIDYPGIRFRRADQHIAVRQVLGHDRRREHRVCRSGVAARGQKRVAHPGHGIAIHPGIPIRFADYGVLLAFTFVGIHLHYKTQLFQVIGAARTARRFARA